MARLPDNKFSPPDTWQKFESLIHELYGKEWKDPKIKKNGRQGQPQNGVDIWGHRDGAKHYSGVQCKEKDIHPERKLTFKEVTDEVAKASKFKPKLGDYEIATTATRDSALDEKVRLFNDGQRKIGGLQVHISYWEDITDAAKRHPELTAHYFGVNYDLNDVTALNQISRVAEDITEARELIDQGSTDTGVEKLEKIKVRFWSDLTKTLQMRVAGNLGVGAAHRGEVARAIDYFVEAYQLAPDDEKACVNMSWVELERNNKVKARALVEGVVKEHPASLSAYTNLLSTYDNLNLKDALKLVPEHLRAYTEIASALGHIAQNQGSAAIAKKYYETAITNAKLPIQKYEAQRSLAELLINEAGARDVISLRQLDSKQMAKFTAAAKLMQDAWNDLRAKELAQYHLELPIRLGHVQRITKSTSDAVRTANEILRIDSTNEGANLILGLIASQAGNPGEAETFYTQASKDGSVDAQMLLAEVQLDLGKTDLAVGRLRKLSKQVKDIRQLTYITLMLSSVQMANNDPAGAEATIEEFLKIHPKNLTFRVQQAIIKKVLNDTEGYQSLLKSIDPNEDGASRDEQIVLADELHKAALFGEALGIYEGIVDPSKDTEWTRRMLDCYFQLGDYKKALAIASELRETHGPLSSITELETHIYESIGELEEAKRVCEEYLKAHPSARSLRIRLAVLQFRTKDFESLDELLAGMTDFDDLDLSEMVSLVLIFGERGLKSQARELIYGFRDSHPNDPEAHSRYITYFFLKENEAKDLDPERVLADSVVTVSSEFGDQKYLIHHGQTDMTQHRLKIDEPIAKKLLGKSVGDKVDLGEKDPHIVTIKEIASKYIAALHESQDLFPSFFPDHPSLKKFAFDPDHPELAIEEMRRNADARTNAVSAVDKLYRDGKLTIGAFSSMIGKNVVEVFYGFQARGLANGLNVFKGAATDIQAASRSIDGRQLVADVTSLITLHDLGVGDKVVEHYGKIGVTRSTVEDIEQHLTSLRGIGEDGYSTISSSDGQLLVADISPEVVDQRIDNAESILHFVEEHCEIVVPKKALDVNASRVKELRRVLGDSSADTVMAAASTDKQLYSEDNVLRQIAKAEFGIDSVWSHAILIRLSEDGVLSIQEYQGKIIELTQRSFNHTSFDAAVLIRAAELSHWRAEEPLNTFVSILSDKTVDLDSMLPIVVELLYSVWKNSVDVGGRNVLVASIVRNLAARGGASSTLANMKKLVTARFRLWPSGATDLNNSLDVAFRSV